MEPFFDRFLLQTGCQGIPFEAYLPGTDNRPAPGQKAAHDERRDDDFSFFMLHLLLLQKREARWFLIQSLPLLPNFLLLLLKTSSRQGR